MCVLRRLVREHSPTLLVSSHCITSAFSLVCTRLVQLILRPDRSAVSVKTAASYLSYSLLCICIRFGLSQLHCLISSCHYADPGDWETAAHRSLFDLFVIGARLAVPLHSLPITAGWTRSTSTVVAKPSFGWDFQSSVTAFWALLHIWDILQLFGQFGL